MANREGALLYGAVFEQGRGSCLTENFVTEEGRATYTKVPHYMEALVLKTDVQEGWKQQPTNRLEPPYKG